MVFIYSFVYLFIDGLCSALHSIPRIWLHGVLYKMVLEGDRREQRGGDGWLYCLEPSQSTDHKNEQEMTRLKKHHLHQLGVYVV